MGAAAGAAEFGPGRQRARASPESSWDNVFISQLPETNEIELCLIKGSRSCFSDQSPRTTLECIEGRRQPTFNTKAEKLSWSAMPMSYSFLSYGQAVAASTCEPPSRSPATLANLRARLQCECASSYIPRMVRCRRLANREGS
jgi:hypothetical protein